MPPTSSRKRAAPGSSPAVGSSQIPPSYASNQVSNSNYLGWNPGLENTGYSDPSTYNMNSYGGNGGMAQAPFDQPAQTPTTQLARRPNVNRQQLVQTGQRQAFDSGGQSWGQFGDEAMLDNSQMANGGTLEENDNIELLEERAAVAKRDAQSKRKQIPPFVQKLSSFLDDGKNTELIRWSDRGDSFVVLDEDEFAKTLIPELFKHNNYASFVRQLNMYGFHKRVGLSDNSMKASERKNKSPSEYYNPYFKRGHPNLLWLINKPKGGGKLEKGSTGRQKQKPTKQGENGDRDSDDDENIEEVYGNNVQPSGSRALSAAPESGSLQRRDVAVLQNQLAEIQKQQGAITNAIGRLRKDHNQLYEQSMAFQTLHDRHENSINAILTFLATVYNRSLDGQGPQNIAQMFGNGIPQHPDQQHQGNVVDIGDVANQPQPHPGSVSPHRRAQRLLMAPPSTQGRANPLSPSGAFTPQAPTHSRNTQQSGAIEELFETSPSDSTHIKSEPISSGQNVMMDIINNTNARSSGNNGSMQFPEMLSHYENANGNSPLTSEQRDSMLQLIANTTSAAGSNNALTSPTPPQPPSVEDLGYTQAEIDLLSQLQHDQDARINEIKNIVEPLSPSGSIPGLGDGGSYFNGGGDTIEPQNGNLDLDQFLDSGAYYNGSSPINADYNFDTFGENTGMGDSQFDMGMDGANDGLESRRIENLDGSEAATPDMGTPDNGGMQGSSNKKRRKN